MGENAHQLKNLAGEVGIEPTNVGIKIRCLTTWRLPNETMQLNLSAGAAANLARQIRACSTATAAIPLVLPLPRQTPQTRKRPSRSSRLEQTSPATPDVPP